jgi:hypothetical protein
MLVLWWERRLAQFFNSRETVKFLKRLFVWSARSYCIMSPAAEDGVSFAEQLFAARFTFRAEAARCGVDVSFRRQV